MRLSLVSLVASLLGAEACLPGLGWGYNPYNPLGGLGVGGIPGVGLGGGLGYPYGYGGRLGPFRSQANHDAIRSASVLNCRALDESCRWSNTNEDEMDWVSGKTHPDVLKWHATLASSVNPDVGAGALISAQRRGWEGGMLVSDPLPCVSAGLRLTVTAWKSKLGPLPSQPKLLVCSKNANDVRVPLLNCVEVDVRNGVPMSVDVPVPGDANAQGQIVINGNNFAAPEGGALFMQDIRVEGDLACTSARTADQHPTLVEPLPMPNYGGVTGEEKPVPAPQPREYPSNGGAPKYSTLERNEIDLMDPAPAVPSNPFKSLDNNLVQENLISDEGALQAVKDTCLAISCDATDYLHCNFWRSSGSNQWEIASSRRIASPKHSITTSPGGAEKFLVAPFSADDTQVTQYALVSEQLTIPPSQEVFFCFYEFFSTNGFSLSICTDSNECFYKKNTVDAGEEPDWKLRCTKLPPGSYELRVHAENHGSGTGELGFLPVRLAKDAQATNLYC